MSLQPMQVKGESIAKRVRKAQRRHWAMQRAIRFSLYVGSLAALLVALFK